MRSTEKIAELRRFAHLKALDPERAFERRLEAPRRLLGLAEARISRGADKLEARRQYVVALCAAFEVFWRDFFRRCIDDAEITPMHVQHLTKPSAGIADVAFLLNKRVSLGEFVSCCYTFQSCETVDRAFSEVFKIGAFAEIAKEKLRFVEKGGVREGVVHGSQIVALASLIDRCFEVRHETVHNMGVGFRPSLQQVRDFEAAMQLFNAVASRILAKHVLLFISFPHRIASGEKPGELSRFKDRVLTRKIREFLLGKFSTSALGVLKKVSAPHSKGRRHARAKMA